MAESRNGAGDPSARAREKYDRKRPPITLRLMDVQAEVEARTPKTGSLGVTVRRDLARYYALMREAVGEIGLTRDEACAVMDACNGLFLDDFHPLRPSMIWSEVADAVELNGLDEKWKIDGEQLVRRLRLLSPTQVYALADAITRFWAQPERDTDDLLQEIGITND